MEVTKVTAFPVNTASGKVKANGVVTINECIDLKYILMQGPKDLFLSWAGGKSYEKKDGTKAWDSPIFIKDKEFNDNVTRQVIAKYKSLAGAASSRSQSSSNSSATNAENADDIPF